MDDLCAMPRGQEWLHTRVTRCFRRTHWAFRVDIKLMVGVSKKIDEGYTYIIWRSNLCSGWVPLFSVLFCPPEVGRANAPARFRQSQGSRDTTTPYQTR